MNDESDYLSGLARNPAYGSGYFLRAWSMQRLAPDRLRVAMEDTFHALTVEIVHDDAAVLDVDAQWMRHPISSCASAARFLSNVAGLPLTSDILRTASATDMASHCTHMFDSFRLGLAHIARDRPDRRYDIVLPDSLGGPRPAQLLVDGIERLSIVIDADMTLLLPDHLAGVPLMRGLAKWARHSASDQVFEWLFMIQRAMFVSWGRKVDMVLYRGTSAAIAGPPEGSCYASQPDRYAAATRNGNERPGLTREEALDF